MSNISFESQIRLWHSADLIICPHGGHMANALFCKTGTQIVEMDCSLRPHSFINANTDFAQHLNLTWQAKRQDFMTCYCETNQTCMKDAGKWAQGYQNFETNYQQILSFVYERLDVS